MSYRGLSLDKLRNKVIGRRSSEPSVQHNLADKRKENGEGLGSPVIIVSSLDEIENGSRYRHRAHSTSTVHSHNHNSHRSGSKVSFTSRLSTKDLVKQETSQIILKKLSHVLEEIGVQSHIPIKTTNGGIGDSKSKLVQIYVANSNDCIFLPAATSNSYSYEDIENGNSSGNFVDQNYTNEARPSSMGSINQDSVDPLQKEHMPDPIDSEDEDQDEVAVYPEEEGNFPFKMFRKMTSCRSPNYLNSGVDGEVPIPHTFAVIIELKKETSIKEVNIEFCSMTSIYWPNGDDYNKTYTRKTFKIGSFVWNLKLSDAYYYINTSNSNQVSSKDYSAKDFEKLAKFYTLYDINSSVDEPDSGSSRRNSSSSFTSNPTSPNNVQNSNNLCPDTYKEGFYVFVLPILLPVHIPASINSINGSLAHKLNISLVKSNEKLYRKGKIKGSYELPMVRTPPLSTNSITDKPIYVNRIWNDSLHYIITFPKKYISLGSEYKINVKLVPLIKDLVVKRIKFNVLERITYASRDFTKEFDYDGDDPFHTKKKYDGKARERVVPVCELKAKGRIPAMTTSLTPYKEERIKCPKNNLLYSCYENYSGGEYFADDPLYEHPDNMEDLLVASPLQINIALPFLTTKADKTIISSSLDCMENCAASTCSRSASPAVEMAPSQSGQSSPDLAPSSPVIGSLETHITHTHDDINLHGLKLDNETMSLEAPEFMAMEQNDQENIQQGYTTISKALYPDSNYRHIQIYHRLQVCFRISKPDEKDKMKMHHYEVVVDTPIVLLSAKCSEESIQLPKYDELDNLNYLGESMNNMKDDLPGFEKEGLSVHPLSFEVEPPPSFEEAMTAASPIIRSTSLADDNLSLLSSFPDVPAPVYTRTEEDNIRNNSVTIDTIINDLGEAKLCTDISTIKTSLESSFSTSSNNDICPSKLSEEDSSKTDSASSTDPPSTLQVEYVRDIDHFNLSEGSSIIADQEELNREQINIKDNESIQSSIIGSERESNRNTSNSTLELEIETKADGNKDTTALSYAENDLDSIITRDSEFSQSIPLLDNASKDELGSIESRKSNLSSLKRLAPKNSVESRPDIFSSNIRPQGLHRVYR